MIDFRRFQEIMNKFTLPDCRWDVKMKIHVPRPEKETIHKLLFDIFAFLTF